jgi:outer membrane lipoprotein SlyB
MKERGKRKDMAMNTTSLARTEPERGGAASPKVLWGTIGLLALIVVALGGVLVHQHSGGDAPAPATPPAAIATPAPSTGPEDGGMPPSAAAPQTASNAPGATNLPAPVRAPNTAANGGAAPAPAIQPGGSATAAASPGPVAAPVCAVCGRVESVRTVRRAAPATGVGAVAGGVLGGVLGNQFGHGGGRTAATVIGAVGGGYAGHTIEQRVRTETRYQVRVRMDDGSLRTVETRTAPPIGKAVTLKGQVLRPAEGRA